jgi:hypothetical protein
LHIVVHSKADTGGEEYNALYYVTMETFSSLPLNLISWNKAFHVYPYGVRFVQHCTGDEALEAGLEVDYGYVDALTKDRRVGDKHTWIIELDIEGVVVSDIPDAVIESSMFRLEPGWPAPRTPPVKVVPRYNFHCIALRWPVLKYQYTIPAARHSRDAKLDQGCIGLLRRLREWTDAEFEKVPKDQRPLEYTNWKTDENFGALKLMLETKDDLVEVQGNSADTPPTCVTDLVT